MRKKTILVKPIGDYTAGTMLPPVPAMSLLPDWYKNMGPYVEGTPNHPRYLKETGTNLTIKKCVPFRDGLGAGYILPLSADVYVEKTTVEETNAVNYRLHWATVFEAIGTHAVTQIAGMPFHASLVTDVAFKWNNPWILQTPPGYSLYFSHPRGYTDLPFETLSGLVDTDKHPVAINFPFLLRHGTEGIIPRGTPIVQFFPVKRESWKLKTEKYNYKEVYSSLELMGTSMNNTYKSNWWTRKEFN